MLTSQKIIVKENQRDKKTFKDKDKLYDINNKILSSNN